MAVSEIVTPTRRTAASATGWRGWLRSGPHEVLLGLLIFGAVDFAFFGVSVLPSIRRTCACGGGPDPSTYMWFLAWWPHALLHGANPFVTNALFAPGHINLGAVDEVPGPALLATPLTLLFGPLVSYNVLALSAPVLAAFFAFLLCRYVTGSFWAALVGGYIFGFSPYMLGHMLGHLDLVLTFPIPAAVHLTLRLIDGRVGRRTYVALMTLLLTILFLSQPELTMVFVILGAAAFGAAAALAPASRARLGRAIPPVVASGALALLVTSVFTYYAVTGDVDPHFFDGFGNTFVADALGFLVPTPIVRLGRSWFAAVTAGFTGNLAENGVYIGLPMALVIARYGFTRWRTPATRIMLTVLAVVIVLMLGSRLHIDGHPTIALPWTWIRELPKFHEIAPARVGVYMFLIVALVMAMWLSQSRSGRLGAAKWAVAALVVASLVPNVGTGWWHSRPHNPRFFTASDYRSVLRPGEIVLGLPFANRGTSMLWQAETGFRFRIADGYLGALVPPAYVRDLGLPPSNPQVPPDPSALRGFLSDRHVTSVVVDQANPQQWPDVLAAMGLRRRSLGGVYVYTVPSGFR